jgi:hypothetical protein
MVRGSDANMPGFRQTSASTRTFRNVFATPPHFKRHSMAWRICGCVLIAALVTACGTGAQVHRSDNYHIYDKHTVFDAALSRTYIMTPENISINAEHDLSAMFPIGSDLSHMKEYFSESDIDCHEMDKIIRGDSSISCEYDNYMHIYVSALMFSWVDSSHRYHWTINVKTSHGHIASITIDVI